MQIWRATAISHWSRPLRSNASSFPFPFLPSCSWAAGIKDTFPHRGEVPRKVMNLKDKSRPSHPDGLPLAGAFPGAGPEHLSKLGSAQGSQIASKARCQPQLPRNHSVNSSSQPELCTAAFPPEASSQLINMRVPPATLSTGMVADRGQCVRLLLAD